MRHLPPTHDKGEFVISVVGGRKRSLELTALMRKASLVDLTLTYGLSQIQPKLLLICGCQTQAAEQVQE